LNLNLSETANVLKLCHFLARFAEKEFLGWHYRPSVTLRCNLRTEHDRKL
jgi:hypothetical protein